MANNPDVDSEKIYLAGWSHGAWSVMDYMSLIAGGDVSALTDRPKIPVPEGLILFYPYSGLGARSRFTKWTSVPKMIVFLPELDIIANSTLSQSVLKKIDKTQKNIQIVNYPQAHHAFDDMVLIEELQHWYNKEVADDAAKIFRTFLKDEAIR